MEKLLSVVVPVYKVEPYIDKCLGSLLVSPDLMEKLVCETLPRDIQAD